MTLLLGVSGSLGCVEYVGARFDGVLHGFDNI